jgi:hypothetical protein
MRFSLKWILAGMVYVAVAAAAFSFAAKTWVYCDVLWGLTLLTMVYCGVLAVCATGVSRAWGAGFVFASVSYLGILAFSEGKTTTGMILDAAEIKAGVTASPPMRYYGGATMRPIVVGTPSYTPTQVSRMVRAANAVAALVFGLMGSLVGLLAFRTAGREDTA